MSADGGTLGAETLRNMSDDIESLCLVGGCRVEETFGTHYTDEILCDRDAVNLQDIKRKVHQRDKEMVLKKCATADRSPAAVKIEEIIGLESL